MSFLEEIIFRVRPEECIGVNHIFWWSGGWDAGTGSYCSKLEAEKAWLKFSVGRGKIKNEGVSMACQLFVDLDFLLKPIRSHEEF